MSERYKRVSDASQGVHFSKAMFGEAERSQMLVKSELLTSFNAGDIVPIYCREVLPTEELSIDIDFVIRQTTLLTPTMGSMHVDIFAFWVPNRIANQSWKAVEGENFSGSWTADQVSLVPLKSTSSGFTQIPVGSVADYYDFPTQLPIPNSVLSQCHDLKFRGYVMIYNEHFRDQNYQPPIPLSTLNVYQGFLDPANSSVPLQGGATQSSMTINPSTVPDGSVGAGAVAHELYGSGSPSSGFTVPPASSSGRFRALSKPLKANKLHDYFTSVLPSPQKSPSTVFAPVTGTVGSIPVVTSSSPVITGSRDALKFFSISGMNPSNGQLFIASDPTGNGGRLVYGDSGASVETTSLYPNNLQTQAGAEVNGLAIDVSDIRMASAIQQVYEILARGGSRYRSIIASFFGVEVDEAFCDVPMELGRISRDLDLYQTAQTSASSEGSTPQGNLAGFGYTANGGHLFSHYFVEHGYLHIFAVVRHRNVYASYLPRDNFRLNMLDYYLPQLANVSEQPVYTREINPFASDPDNAFGFQEAWAEYRFEPDRVSGLMRTMPEGSESFSIWNYADDFDKDLQIADGEWLKSNSEQVLNRTVAVSSSQAPQFKASFQFKVDKTLPMPTFSVPGMDII